MKDKIKINIKLIEIAKWIEYFQNLPIKDINII